VCVCVREGEREVSVLVCVCLCVRVRVTATPVLVCLCAANPSQRVVLASCKRSLMHVHCAVSGPCAGAVTLRTGRWLARRGRLNATCVCGCSGTCARRHPRRTAPGPRHPRTPPPTCVCVCVYNCMSLCLYARVAHRNTFAWRACWVQGQGKVVVDGVRVQGQGTAFTRDLGPDAQLFIGGTVRLSTASAHTERVCARQSEWVRACVCVSGTLCVSLERVRVRVCERVR
jgi:hypothetical protein